MIEPSQSVQNIFEYSVNLSKTLKHEYITIEHIVYSIMCDQDSYKFLEDFGADADFIKNNLENFLATNLKDLESDKENLKPKKNQFGRTSIKQVL